MQPEYPAGQHTLRMQALFGLRSLLEGIRTADGYFSDVQWCDLVATEGLDLGDALPAIAITWASEQIRGQAPSDSCDSVHAMLPVAIFAAVWGEPLVGNARPNDDQLVRLDQLVADIRSAVGRERGLGLPDILNAVIVSDELSPAGEQRGVAYARVDLEIEYRYPVTDPTYAH